MSGVSTVKEQGAPACGAALLALIRAPTDRLAVDAAGVLTVGGVPATDLVARFGSPLQVAVEETVRANYRRIRVAFAAHWPAPVNILYSIKCNNNLAIRAILSAEGAGGDCCGLGELYASLAGGADPRLLVMNGSNKSAADVAAAVELGITINVDSTDEIDYLRVAVARCGKPASVNLRLKVLPEDLERHLLESYRTQEGAAEGVRRVKWGFTLAAAVPLVQALLSSDGIRLKGFSAHIGHQSNRPEAFAAVAGAFGRAVAALMRQTGVRPEVLDIGGGWAQHREPSARQFAVNSFAIEDYARAATAALRRELGDGIERAALWIEPGRYITSNAQLLLATVGATKRDAGYVWAHVDASTNDLPRIESGRHWYHVLPASRMTDAMAETTEIVGGTCFKSVLAAARAMPCLKRGDIVALVDTGTYAEVFANQFNAVPRPATVLVSPAGVELIRNRETVAEIFANHVIPVRLGQMAPSHEARDGVLARATGRP